MSFDIPFTDLRSFADTYPAFKPGFTLWYKTFPNRTEDIQDKINERKQQAREQLKYTQEELEELQLNIPEWKRNAMIVVDEEEQKKGILKKAVHKVGEKIKGTVFIQKLS